jgi:leader peptidase (prepilin peptidase)/N-methyltransferase
MNSAAAGPALAGLLVGAAAGAAARVLLGRLRRGVVLRPGPFEVCSALITAAGVALGWPAPTVLLVTWIGLLAVTLSAVDLRHHRLPDALTLPAVPFTAVLLVVTEWTRPGTGNLLVGVLVAAVLTALFWTMARVAPRAIGMGDAKLVASLGLATGYLSVASAALGITIAFVLGALVAIAGLVTRRLTMRSPIPFGPCLLAGSWVVIALPEVVPAIL